MRKIRVKRTVARVTAGILAAALMLTGCHRQSAVEDNGTEGSTDNEKQTQEDTTMDEELLANLSAFAMTDVTVTDDYCSNALWLEVSYLLSFDNDKLLAGFRETAGLDMKGATRYSGWENSLIGGHTMGHYLSAMAQAYVNAGVSDSDREAIYEKLTAIVDALVECQENSKGKEGFVFGATILDENNVEKQFDNVEEGKSNITTEAWVPWYTMHKILAGAIEVYELTGYEPALTLAEGIGSWTYNRTSNWTKAQNANVVSIEYGGMNDALYELYAVTGDERYAIAAHCFDQETLFKKIVYNTNSLNNLHANTTIPKFLGALNRYVTCNGKTIDGEVVDATAYLEYAELFWDYVVEHHTYITGANSEWEHFGEDDVLDGERTNCNNETCNVYNMLKLTRMLYEITGDSKYADYYENAFYNTILSSQNPETGMTTYFQPMATGYFKVYGEEFTKFWCCTGSGMENFTKLNDSIYFHSDSDLFVNLYLSSELVWNESNLILTQEAELPESDTITFTVEAADSTKALDFTLRLRIPDWTAGDPVILVNGTAAECEISDGYALVEGLQDGDTVSLTLPMEVVAYTLPDEDSVLGFKYGPVVLSADLGTEDMKTTTTGVAVTIPAKAIVETETLTLPAGVSFEDFVDNINDYMVRDDSADSLTFTLYDTGLTFNTHYTRYEERYGIYFYFRSAEEIASAEAGKQRSSDEILDTVQPGYGQYENDELHALVDNNSVGATDDSTYRYANAGGSFTYRMAVNPSGNNYLSLTLRAEDNGKSLLITSGDTVLFSDTLDYIGLEDTYELRVAIPAELAAAATEVTANDQTCSVIEITFAGVDGAESAKVCDFIYMLDVTPLYTSDETVAYFVDCGDYDPTTVSDGDSFGVYNSVTEQLYGYDPGTGKKWGLIDDANDQYGGSALKNDGLYTAHTLCYEYNSGDGLAKESSNRYTKNQYEDGLDRTLDYAFELPNGTYTVEIGFANPWNCSNGHDIYANIGTDSEQVLATGYQVSKGTLTAQVTVTDGVLTLNFRNATSAGLAINVTYIKILF